MVNTKETAKRWSCNRNWVGKQCREGMIPLAEKKKLEGVTSRNVEEI